MAPFQFGSQTELVFYGTGMIANWFPVRAFDYGMMGVIDQMGYIFDYMIKPISRNPPVNTIRPVHISLILFVGSMALKLRSSLSR